MHLLLQYTDGYREEVLNYLFRTNIALHELRVGKETCVLHFLLFIGRRVLCIEEYDVLTFIQLLFGSVVAGEIDVLFEELAQVFANGCLLTIFLCGDKLCI